jgi:cob(I)alamin adenosyltransferase
MKIYTKGGDKGQTGLFSGERVSKNDPLINALGTVDELNSVLGVARAFIAQEWNLNPAFDEIEEAIAELIPSLNSPDIATLALATTDERMRAIALRFGGDWNDLVDFVSLDEWLHTIQLELFELGAELASGQPGAGRITDAQIERFERWIDELTAGLPPLKNFILPTGHPVAAHLHQARTVSRRAERMIVAAWDATKHEVGQGAGPVQDSEQVTATRFDPVVIRYMNRLNDLLFVLAREGNRVFGVADEEWHSPQSATT